ncbi:MAG TPA: helix-turn-helix domain-containing protein [Ktedonobacterales bacterium]
MAALRELVDYFQARAEMTRGELATAAGYDVRTINYLLSGGRPVRPAHRKRLAIALNLGEDDRAALMAASAGPEAPIHAPDADAARAQAALLHQSRLVAGLTQEELARATGLSRGYVQMLESGRRGPGKRALKSIAEALQLSAYDRAALFTAASAGPPAPAPGAPAPAIYDPTVPSLAGLTEVVGREAWLADVIERLGAGMAASVALVGIPGAGKTTLAVALAHDPTLRARLPNGVLWASLGFQPNHTREYARWANLLGISPAETLRDRTPEEWKRLLHEAIGQRRLLIILDDAWFIADALALCVGGPNCALVVTTRLPGVAHALAPLGIEVIHELDLDESVRLLHVTAPILRATASAEARALERALAELTGGLPLGLALIGRYIKELNPERGRRAASLRAAGRDEPTIRLWLALHALSSARERLKLTRTLPIAGQPVSIRAAIATSERLLGPSERAAFRALAVLPPRPATWSGEAGMAVTGGSAATLLRLLETGLIERYQPVGDDEAPGDQDTRYSIHQAISDYARLEGPPASAVRRMARYYLEFARRHARDLPALAREQSALLEALARAHRGGLHTEFIALTVACAEYFQTHASRGVIEAHLVEAEAVARALGDSASLVTLAKFRALAADRIGRAAEANAHLWRAITLAQERADGVAAADLLVTLSILMTRTGQYLEAKGTLLQALDIATALSLPRLQVEVHRHLSATALAAGDTDDSLAHAHIGLAVARDMGDADLISGMLSAIGNMTANTGRYREAERYLLEALAICRDQGFQLRAAYILTNLGEVACNRGEYAQAIEHLGQALSGGESAHQVRRALVTVNLLRVAIARGEDDQAEALFDQARTALEQANRPDRLLDLYLHAAELALERGDASTASDHLRRAHGLVGKLPSDYPEMRAILELLQGEVELRAGGAALERAAARFAEVLRVGARLKHAELICGARCAFGRLSLRQGDPAAAEVAFRAALASGLEHRALEAEAHFGLARALAAQGASAAADEARASLAIYQAIGHRRARRVEAWLRSGARR